MGGTRIATAHSERGEVTLLRRDDGALELRVNGVFVMDDVHTESERELARGALGAASEVSGASGRLRVFIGGLGLGFTLHEVLRDPAVGDVHVAEIESAVVDWYRAGLVPATAEDRFDDRVRIECGDVTGLLARYRSECLDVILLDVDNGPDYLVHLDNAEVYRGEFLAECAGKLSPGGLVAIWSSAPSDPLVETMGAVFGSVRHRIIPVTLGALESEYHLFVAHRDTGRSADRDNEFFDLRAD